MRRKRSSKKRKNGEVKAEEYQYEDRETRA